MLKKLRNISHQQLLLVGGLVIFLGFTASIIFLISIWSKNAADNRMNAQKQAFESPSTTNKRQIRRIRVSRVNENGELEYLEITASGEINLFDANYNLVKSNLQGYSRINVLFDHISTYLNQQENSSYNNNPQDGTCVIIVTTNLGDIFIPCDDVDDIVEEIDDIEEETFSPSPTPTLLPTIILPTITPPSTSPSPSTIPPSPSPGGPSPTPTPLPDYMTAPPFTCEDYDYLGRPVAISNVICGAR